MNMKLSGLAGVVGFFAIVSSGGLNGYPAFDLSKDLLIVGYDHYSDTDDFMAQTSFACLTAHVDYADLNFYAVCGAYGEQAWDSGFNGSKVLYELAWGPEGDRWTYAFDSEKARGENWARSVERLKKKVRPVLGAGGRIWVAEGGQSDITYDWVHDLLVNEKFSEETIKSRVIVVQHSWWNYKFTTDSELDYLIRKTTFVGPEFRNNGEKHQPIHEKEDPLIKNGNGILTDRSKEYMNEVLSERNQNAYSRALWAEVPVELGKVVKGKNPAIDSGGVDFSDTIEVAWILGLEDIYNSSSPRLFWDRFVVNALGDKCGH